jgi:hypothetical protein
MHSQVGRVVGQVVALALVAVAACTPLTYDEAVDGDLSGDPAAPTAVKLGLGDNTISGTVTTTAPADTRDFVTFSVPHGLQLTALHLARYRDLPSGEPGNRGFHAIAAGPTSAIPGGATEASFLGGDHVDGIAEGTDLLPALADGEPAGTGFSIPLGEGTYTYVIQQTGPQLIGYALVFSLRLVGH